MKNETPKPSKIANTIATLKRCQAARAAGHPVYLTTDPTWLLNMAINRRAGWVEDPHSYGSVQPVRGKLPRFATGDAQRHIDQIGHRVNSRAIVRPQELGEWGPYLMARIPERFHTDD